MTYTKLAAALVALALTAPGLSAQPPAAGTPPSTAQAVDPAALQALQDMGAHLLTLTRFQVSTGLTGERVLADGQTLQHTARAEVDVARPNRLRVHLASARSERVIFYDGQTVTLVIPAQQSYATVAFTASLGALVMQLEARYGVDIPLYDLFLWGTPAAPLDQIESAMQAGQDVIGPALCTHDAFRQGPFDWQLWITTGAQPLPRKLVITHRADEARPQSVSLIDWHLQPTFKDAVFTFTPPQGSTAVTLRPRDKQ